MAWPREQVIAHHLANLAGATPEVRVDAAQKLGALGPLPAEALAALVGALGDGAVYDEVFHDWHGSVVGGTSYGVAHAAAESLAAQGAPGVSATVDAALAGGTSAREWLAQIVAKADVDALVALGVSGCDRVLDALGPTPAPLGPNPRARLRWARGEADAGPREPTTTWIARLAHPEETVAAAAARSLGGAPDPARAAAALAEALLASGPRTDPGLVFAAGESLAALGPVLDEALAEQLIVGVHAPHLVYTWPKLLPALARYNAVARPLVPTLVALMCDPAYPRPLGQDFRRGLSRAAAEAFAALGGLPDAESRRALRALFLRGTRAEQSDAVLALGGAQGLADVVPELRAVLVDAAPAARLDALARLVHLGPVARPALGDVLALVDAHLPDALDGRPSPEFQHLVSLLGGLGPDGVIAVPRLLALLGAPRATRFWAVMALGNLGRYDARVLPALDAIAATDPDAATVAARLRH